MSLENYLDYFIAFLFVLALIGLFAWITKSFLLGNGTMLGFFPEKIKRIQILETTGIDAKRRLLLVRRDGTEHLLLIGGPNDLVIEQGIQLPLPTQKPAKKDDPSIS